MSSANFDPSKVSVPTPSTAPTEEKEASPLILPRNLQEMDTLEQSRSASSGTKLGVNIEIPQMPATQETTVASEEMMDEEVKKFGLMDYLKSVGAGHLAAKVVQHEIDSAKNELLQGTLREQVKDAIEFQTTGFYEMQKTREWLEDKIEKQKERKNRFFGWALGGTLLTFATFGLVLATIPAVVIGLEEEKRDKELENYQKCLDALNSGKRIDDELSGWLEGKTQKNIEKGNIDEAARFYHLHMLLKQNDPAYVPSSRQEQIRDFAEQVIEANPQLAVKIAEVRNVLSEDEVSTMPVTLVKEEQPLVEIERDIASEWMGKEAERAPENAAAYKAVQDSLINRNPADETVLDFLELKAKEAMSNGDIEGVVAHLSAKRSLEPQTQTLDGTTFTKEQDLYYSLALLNAGTITPNESKDEVFRNWTVNYDNPRANLLDLNWHGPALVLEEKQARNKLNISLPA